MKHILRFWLIFCFFPAILSAQNLIFNPGFDMTPWDTGWETNKQGMAYKWVSGDYHSAPRSCILRVSLSDTMLSSGDVETFQHIIPAINCTCRVYFQCFTFFYEYGGAHIGISVKVNGNWIAELDTEDFIVSTWTKWEKIYSNNDTISGIKFWASAYTPNGGVIDIFLLLDDVYIAGQPVGIEESNNPQIVNSKTQLVILQNPVINSTLISYSLPAKSKVELKLYDLSGREVRSLVNEEKRAGSYAVNLDGRSLATGVYFVKLKTTDFEQTRKLILMK